MIVVGDDWAETHHDVCLMDESGTQVAAPASTRRPGKCWSVV